MSNIVRKALPYRPTDVSETSFEIANVLTTGIVQANRAAAAAVLTSHVSTVIVVVNNHGQRNKIFGSWRSDK